MPRTLALLAALGAAALASCTGPDAREAPPAAGQAPPPPAAARATNWTANPATGVAVRAEGDTLVVETGPHAVAWPTGAAALEPPYTVEATLRKVSGRIHEGTGLLFGGTGLEGPEAGQEYAYFLTRGDGSFLIKQRRGAETPIVRDWTTHPAILRDQDGSGAENRLRVEVGAEESVFWINGQEVARVPSAELRVRGVAGLRVSHELQLRVTGFRAAAGAAAGGGPP